MAAPKGPRAPRTLGREEPEERMPSRVEDERIGSLDRLDPNAPIRTRSGREARLTFTGNEDEFDFHAMGIVEPVGWHYAWKVKEVNGQERRQDIARWQGNGWEPVPAERHDGLCMPKGYKGDIERGGLVLCERDSRLTEIARRAERQAALAPLRQADDLAGLAISKGYMNADMAEFADSSAKRFTGVRRSREAIGLKNPTGYQVDE